MEITLDNTYTGDSQFNPCTELVAGAPLTLNKEALSSETERYSLTLWFKREASSVLRLGIANSHLQIAEDGKLLLVDTTNAPLVGTAQLSFQLGTANPPFQQIDSEAGSIDSEISFKDMVAPANQWHHLAWVKNENAHILYLNGIASQPQTLVNAPNPASVNSMESVGANAYIVHLHAYDRALEASQIVTDRLGQYTTTESFTDQYPINFALKDRSITGAPEMSDNKLIIEDIVAKERIYQRLEVTNVTDQPLRFIPNSNAVSKENYHLEVRFRNGTFVSPADYLKFDGFEESNLLAGESPAIRDGWQATEPKKNAEDGSWSVYLLSTSEYRLPPESDPSEQEPLDFLFEYTTADGSLGGRATRVELSYKQIEYESDHQEVEGTRAKQIDIINNSSNNAHVSALNERVTQADAKVDQLEEDAREEIDNLVTLLDNPFGDDSTSDLINPSVSNFAINVWQETNSYTSGDYVTKDGILYKANSDIASDTPWNVANWEDRSWDASSTYVQDDYVQKDAKIYRAKTNTAGDIPGETSVWEVYTPSKEVLKSIIGVLDTLAQNIKAVDNELDNRALSEAVESLTQGDSFPLVASVCALTHDDQPTAGIVIGTDSTEKPKLQFTLNNTDLSPVTFTDNAEFLFMIPKGETADKLVETLDEAGTMNPQSESPSDTQDTVVFKWKPSSEKTIQAGEKETFTISNITPNAMPGFVTVFIEYQGIEGYSEGRLGVGVSKITRDISQLVGGGKVGIGTTSPEHSLDLGTDSASTIRLVSEHNGTAVRIGAAGGDNDITLLRVDLNVCDTDDANFGFSLRYMGSRSGNNNSLSIFSDNVQGAQVEALTVLQDGKIGIGTESPSEKLEVNGNVNTTGKVKEDGHDLIPVGTIVMWNGAIAPNGWVLCDGNGTYHDIDGIQRPIPNLSGRFVMGQGQLTGGGSYTVGQTAGEETVTLETSEMPAHTHGPGDYHTSTDGSHSHQYQDYYVTIQRDGNQALYIESNENDGKHSYSNRTTQNAGSHNHEVNGGVSASTGGNGSHENKPPYYVLAYIMRVH